MGFIYKYTSPSGKCYIGQTVQSIKIRAKKNNHFKRVKGYIFTYEPFIDWEYYSYKKPGPK